MSAQSLLLSMLPQTHCDDLRSILTSAGYTLTHHHLASVPPIEFESYSTAIIVVPDELVFAIEQSRRWRTELHHRYWPILWIGNRNSAEWTTTALQAGADGYLSRPLDTNQLLAQLHALERTSNLVKHHAQRAAEVPVLAERLHKLYEHGSRSTELARRIHQRLSPQRLPNSPHVRFAVHHRPRSRDCGDAFDIWCVGSHWHIVLTDTPNAAVAVYLRTLLQRPGVTGDAGDVLRHTNQSLLDLDQPEFTLAAGQFVTIDESSGRISYARAAMPMAVCVPAEGPIQVWQTDGPLLGVHPAEYVAHDAMLLPGDKVILCSDGVVPLSNDRFDLSELIRFAEQNRHTPAEVFVHALAAELTPHAPADDDFTLIVLERLRP